MTDKQIRDVLATCAGLTLDVHSLADDADLFRAGVTSHATVNVMLGLEDAFDVEFPAQMLERATFSSVYAIRQALSNLGADIGS